MGTETVLLTLSAEGNDSELFAGAGIVTPEPVLEGTPEQRRAIWQLVASRGDRQMKALAAQYLEQIADS
jgi:hypothetical protein